MPSDPGLDEDRRYCRDVLPRVSRTFALNIRLLSGDFAESVRTAYLLCRTADALEDSWPGSAPDIRERFDALQRAISGDGAAVANLAARAAAVERAGRTPVESAELDLVAHLGPTLRVFAALPAADRAAIAECLATMGSGMSRYAARGAGRGTGVPYLDHEGELHDYCWVVAGCVGVMLTRLFGERVPARDAREEAQRAALAPVVGEALQLTNILLDWPSDVRRGRCYVPAAWLEEFGLTPVTLVGENRHGVPELEARLEILARRALAKVPAYLACVPRRAVRYRLFVLWPASWALRSLEHARRDPEFPWGARRPRLPKSELWGAAIRALLGGEDAALGRSANLALER